MTENIETSYEIKKKRWIKRSGWILAALTLLGFALIALLLYWASQDDLPTFEDLENPQYNEASVIYDAKARSFGKYYVENREPVAYADISPHVINALLSTEDERFHSHAGIDLIALSRVAFKTLLMGKSSSGGGSTISQQLAKLLFSRPSLRNKSSVSKAISLVKIKLKEWITAVKIERSFTKEEILTMYLNKFEFINGAHGIEAAAETYFRKKQKDLAVEEAAMLVGMLKNPSLYNPRRFPANAQSRRNTVLGKMYSHDHISKSDRDSLYQVEVNMDHFERLTQSEGPAPYFRAELTKWLRKTFKEKNITKPDGTPYNIYTDGLQIYTTIDLDYQRNAEKALFDHMKWNQQRYWRAWKKNDPWTYDAEPEEIKIRLEVLERRKKASERYLALRKKHLDNTLSKITKALGEMPLSDNVIQALLSIEKKKNSIAHHIEKGTLKSSHKKGYAKLLKNALWSELKTNWNKLETAYTTAFKEEVPMKVYDYDEGEIEKTMSPEDSVRYYTQHLQGGMLAVDPHTGQIKAWVGGINHQHFKYDHVNTRRAVGSTIKPFVYATAISLQNLSPCQKMADIAYTINPGEAAFQTQDAWSPANANGEFTGNNYNLYQGLLHSKNSITVALVKQMGNVEVVRELLDNAGISKTLELSNGRLAVPNVPSICLGAVDLTLKEMTGAYTVFANNGTYTEPVFIDKILDKNGRVLYTGVPHRKAALDPLHNAIMVDMLQNNVGGKHGMGLKVPNGGKTGTTNDYTDGWFMGITPNLVVGVWTGGDDPWIRFTTLADGQGYVMARPIFSKFLHNLEKDTLDDFRSDVRFPNPPPQFEELTDCDKYNVETPEELQELRKKNLEALDEIEEDFEDFDLDDNELDGDDMEMDDMDDLEIPKPDSIQEPEFD